MTEYFQPENVELRLDEYGNKNGILPLEMDGKNAAITV